MPDLKLAHELDASWLIALFLAVYGGDPGIEKTVSAEAAAAVAGRIITVLRPVAEGVSAERVASVKLPQKTGAEVIAGLKRLGVTGHTHQDGERIELARLPTLTPHPVRCWCFVELGGKEVCVCVRLDDPQPQE